MKTIILPKLRGDMNPLDAVEQVAFSREWAYDRTCEHELVAEMFCQWTDLRLWASWRPELGCLLVSCNYGVKVPAAIRERVYALMALVNERLWMGHFDLVHDEDFISYRYTLMVDASCENVQEMVEAVVDNAQKECERFFPALQSVLWGNKTAMEALEVAMFETAGEA